MIVIRDEQMRSLRIGAYLARVEAECCPRLQDQPIPVLHALVERALRTARAHGFDDDDLLVRYLRLVVRLGDDLSAADTAAWALPILSDPLHRPADLMDELETWAERALAERAASRATPPEDTASPAAGVPADVADAGELDPAEDPAEGTAE